MAALIKGANGLKLYNHVASGAMRKATVQWQTNILVPSLRMCSGKDNVDKSVTQKVSGKQVRIFTVPGASKSELPHKREHNFHCFQGFQK